MRVAVIAVSMLVVATSSEASKSCMSKTEARQHFGSVHIYWHGQDHCWDATPGRHHQTQKIQRENSRQVQQKIDQSKWHNAMSEMLAVDEPAPKPGVQTSWDARYHGNDDTTAGAQWVDRWVDIAQVAPPPIIESKPEPMVAPPPIIAESMVQPRYVVLVFFGFVPLMLAAVVVLFSCTIYEQPKSMTPF
jgi:hypothetical protein